MMKKTIYKIHKIAGLTIGALIFLMAVSGFLISFRSEVMPVVYPQFKVPPKGEEAPVSLMLTRAQAYLGERRITNLYAAEAPDEAFLILFRDSQKLLPEILSINPYSAEVISEMGIAENIFALGLFFHANLFLGKWGGYLVGFSGLILVMFVLSGLYIWLPKRNGFQKFKKLFQGKSNSSSQRFHHLLGIILAVPLVFSGITGFLTIFDYSYDVMKSIKGDPTRPEELIMKRSCSFEQDLAALSLLNQEQLKNLISVHMCTPKNAYMKVSYGLQERHFTGGYARILIDSKEKKIVQSFDSSIDPASWNIKRLIIYPLHSGEYFGLTGRWIVFLSGIGLSLIFISGIRLSYKRKRYKDTTTWFSNQQPVSKEI